MKHNPGNYVAMMRRFSDHTYMAAAVTSGLLRGIKKRYAWRTLEPREGVYDFRSIAADLQFCLERGLQLVVYIEDKTFIPEHAVPTYLEHLSQPGTHGYTAIRWDPVIIGRFNELIRRVGQYFNSHPAFEGVAIEETAPSLSDALLDKFGYTPELYANAYSVVIENGLYSMPDSKFFWTPNFMPRNTSGGLLDMIVKEFADAPGFVFGGPDALPDNEALKKRTWWIYTGNPDVTKCIEVSPGCYNTAGLTAQAAHDFSVDVLGVSYLFWYNFRGDSFGFVDDALKVIDESTL